VTLCYDLSEINTVGYGNNDGGEGRIGKIVETPGPDLFLFSAGVGIFWINSMGHRLISAFFLIEGLNHFLVNLAIAGNDFFHVDGKRFSLEVADQAS